MNAWMHRHHPKVGRTGVRHGTRDPNWLIDEDNGGVTTYGDDAVAGNEFHLPFVVPLSEKWGSEAWPPMTLEVTIKLVVF